MLHRTRSGGGGGEWRAGVQLRDVGLELACLHYSDVLTWDVYADWLEDHDESEYAAFCRNWGRSCDDVNEWMRFWKLLISRHPHMVRVIWVTRDFYSRLRQKVWDTNDLLGQDLAHSVRRLMFCGREVQALDSSGRNDSES